MTLRIRNAKVGSSILLGSTNSIDGFDSGAGIVGRLWKNRLGRRCRKLVVQSHTYRLAKAIRIQENASKKAQEVPERPL